MATNGQTLRKFLRGETLLESEIQQLERALDQYDSAAMNNQQTRRGDRTWRFDNIKAGTAEFDVPPTRAVVYTAITNGNILDATETVLAFSTSRGYIRRSDGCMVQVTGTTTKFTKAPGVDTHRDVFVFGDVTWDTRGSGIRDLYINYYDVDNTFLGATTISVTPSLGNWATHSFAYHDALTTGQYITLSVYQDSGFTIALQSANIGFALI
jgi:hypothetical protein